MERGVQCGGCRIAIETRQYLICCICTKHYDLICANVSEQRFHNTLTAEHRARWKCQECRSKEPKTDNSDTPVRGAQPGGLSDSLYEAGMDLGIENVTFRNQRIDRNLNSRPQSPMFSFEEFSEELKQFRDEMRAVRRDMSEFKSVMLDLKASIECCNERIDDLSERVERLEKKRNDGENVESFESTIAELKMDLNERDQETMSNDVEIVGITETKNERSVHIMLTVANKLGINIEERDIVSVSRVGIERPPVEGVPVARPRPLVVRFARRSLRDHVLSAARVRRRLSTTDMGLPGAPCTFYINERLTKFNRRLFYLTRQTLIRAKWKYAWTREGKIYVRREHGAPRIRIRSDLDLKRVFE